MMEIMQLLLLVNPKIDTKYALWKSSIYAVSVFFTHVFFIVTRLNLKN